MTTKAIRRALKMAVDDASFGDYADEADALSAALEAVAAIEKMARTILDSGRLDGAPMKREVELLERIAKEAP